VPLKVKQCEYMVDLNSDWVVPGEAALHIHASFFEELLKRTDAEGQVYERLVAVQWDVSASSVGTCTFTNISVEGGEAGLKGQKDNNGARLVVDMTFAPAHVTVTGFCTGKDPPRIDFHKTVDIAAGPLRLAVPSDTGGASSQTQDLKDPDGTRTGGAFIVVYPSNALDK
jgi:hypothetical protein